MEKETIDVLIPAYNVKNYIGMCLDSLLSQTYKNIRIVVVDDGSTDGTINVLNTYKNQFNNIEIYTKKNEKNISKTRNFLLTKIKSKYFTFFDSDDYCENTYIETLYHLLKTYDADMSMCSRIRQNEPKTINFEPSQKNYELLFLSQHEAIAEMLSSNKFNGSACTKLMKTSTIKNAKFDENIHYGEDLDFVFKVMLNCNKFVYTNQQLYHYIIRKNSIVTSKFKTTKLTCLDCYDNIINKIKDDEELLTCAKSMQGLIAIELLYYTWRDRYKDKSVKNKLKTIIKESIPHIKRNKRLSKLLRCTPLVWRLTKIM